MDGTTVTATLLRLPPSRLFTHPRAGRLVERNLTLYRRTWLILVSGVAEPLLYLFSIGVGVGKLVGHLPGGIGYTAYAAPGLLAGAAMTGVGYDSTFNLFEKLRLSKLYDAVLATPVSVGDIAVGETAWALIRGTLYDIAFIVVMAAMGLIHSTWATLDLPAVVLIGFAFAATGIAATTFLRSWQDFEWVQLVLLPLFLFSATMYPLTVYPGPLQLAVRCSPLYQGVALLRALTLGGVDWSTAGHVGYLVGMGTAGLAVGHRRLAKLLLR